MAALQKPEQTLVSTKMYPHGAAHPSSHPAAAAASSAKDWLREPGASSC